MKQYDEVRTISTGQGDDYTTGCLLDYSYFENSYRLIAADLSKQKVLDADSRAIQQVIFTGAIKAAVANTRVVIKRNNIRIFRGNSKSFVSQLKILLLVKKKNK